MKRLTAVIAALAALLIASACAEEPGFRLENGLSWGMTRAEISGLFGEEGMYSETLFEGVDMMQCLPCADTPDGESDVWLSMVLVDDKLSMIMYDVLRADDPAVKERCVAELTELYGTPTEGGMDRFMASLGMLDGDPDMSAADIGAPGTGCSWELPDGTFACVFDLTDISFGVYFVDEENFSYAQERYEAANVASVELSPLLYSTLPEYLRALELSELIPAVMRSDFDDVCARARAQDMDAIVISGAPDGPDVIMFTEDFGAMEVTTRLMFGGNGPMAIAFSAVTAGHDDGAAREIGEVLTEEFGAPAPVDDAGLRALDMLAYGAHETAEPASMSGWTLEDGTVAVLVPVTDGELSGAELYFISAEML